MYKFFKVNLYDNSKSTDEKQVVVLNPLAISSILPGDEKDIIKMQNGDIFEVEHTSYNPSTKLNEALKYEKAQSVKL